MSIIILSKKGNRIHTFLMNLPIQSCYHTLLVMCFYSISVINYVAAPRCSKTTSHSLYNSISSATVPFVSPTLTINHCIYFTICYHHNLSYKNSTFLPEPPAFKFSAFKVLIRFVSPGLERELLVATLRGLLMGYLLFLLTHYLPLKSKAYCYLTEPIVTVGSNTFFSPIFLKGVPIMPPIAFC